MPHRMDSDAPAMRRRNACLIALTLACFAVAAFFATAATAASPAPAWTVRTLAVPTNFVPEDESGTSRYEVTIANSGAAATDGTPITVVDTLPPGIGVKKVELLLFGSKGQEDFSVTQCTTGSVGDSETVTCVIPTELPDGSHPAIVAPGEGLRMIVQVKVPADASGELLNRAEVEGGGAAPAASTVGHVASSEPVGSGFEEFKASPLGPDGQPFTLAGGHPEQLAVNFAINTKATPPGTKAFYAPAGGDIKDIAVALPAGLVGNPTAVPECTLEQFRTIHSVKVPGSAYPVNDCPPGSAVGLAIVQQIEGAGGILPVPIYNLTPPKGVAAQLGFEVATAPFYINAQVRTGGDYGITTVSPNLTESKRVTAFQAILWGTPADPSHDPIRGSCLVGVGVGFPFSFASCPAGLQEVKPFLRMPTSCGGLLTTTMSFNTWLHNDLFSSAGWPAPAATGCNSVPFDPSLQARPTTTVADAPTGLEAHLHIPQEVEGPQAQGQADLRQAEVRLPAGIAINPSGANGLGACDPEQIDLDGSAPATCPEDSRIGTVEVATPLLDHPLEGSIYVATPDQNPFGSLLAIYLAIDDTTSGVVIKLAGQVAADPQTGQLTTTFAENPQLPFEDFELKFFSGPRAALRTPAVCGSYTTTYTLTPWSAPEAAPVSGSDSYAIDRAPGGGACASQADTLPGTPAFTAGTMAPIARAHSPFVLHLSREDGTKELSSLKVSLPPGLLGKLAGIPYCSEVALAAAAAKSGRQEAAEPSCPEASRVGTVAVAAGAGPAPYNTKGIAYLAGPYKGAPLSIAIVTPATAGPYDLGTVVVRSSLAVDPETAKITATSDPIPRILQGIPLDVRSIDLRLDRPSFTLNPTSCDPMAITGQAGLVPSGAAALSVPFQVGECGALGFKPKLAMQLKGGTKRSSYPALTATLTMPEGGANIARASVSLPHSEFLAQAHIRTICTRVQFAAAACPPGSVYGTARAYSPLLDSPLEGPVYLRSSSNPLPDMVADLRGQIHVALVGRIDSHKGGIRTTFETVPDAPVSKFVLSMQGGKKGLLENSRNICGRPYRARAAFTAQNGKAATLKPVMKAKCPKKAGKKKQSRKRGRQHR
jgi:hypothetical protein